MTKRSGRQIPTVATLVWLLVELLRGWTPLLITVFGRASETPPELIGAFALGVTATPLVILLILGRQLVAVSTLAPALTVVALAARLVLPFFGGWPLLVIGTVGIVAVVLALTLTAARVGTALMPGVFAGLAFAVTTHAALGTWGAVWRRDLPGMVVALVLIALVAASFHPLRDPGTGPASARFGWLVFPVVLLTGITLANPARALVISSWGGAVVALAVTVAAVLVCRTWGPAARAVSAVVVVAAVAATILPDPLPSWSLFGFAIGMPALAVLLAAPSQATSTSPIAVSRAVAAGAVVFTVLLFAFYAGYDLGYRADIVVVGLAVVIAVVALLPRPQSPRTPGVLPVRRGAAAVLVAAVLVGVGPLVAVRELPPSSPSGGANVRLAAWNVQMGFGMDGTWRPDEAAEVLREESADVVLLSEVDRGWLLNGGQEQLTVLARLLGYHLAFGPAGDQVWGDAILSRWPLSNVESTPLPAYDSLTGAQALAATVDAPEGQLRVISTHLQPDADGSDPTLRQTQDLARFTPDAKGAGLPVVVGGDLNFEPGSRSWEAIIGTGVTDALAEARPLRTWSSEEPQQEIDHVFVSEGVTASNPGTRPNLLSDHLPVFVDLTLR